MKILVTGAAGFIGYHLCEKLIQEGHSVVGIDNLNDYYAVQLKKDRLKALGIEEVSKKSICEFSPSKNFTFIKLDITDRPNLEALFKKFTFDTICHLAAQAGVRYSIENPKLYIETNILGFSNILEIAKENRVAHLLYASSSSVYGKNGKVPFSVDDNVDRPVSMYAATKKSNELMAHVYSHLYGMKTTGLRFFTVYGPWGRPDMAPMLFAKAIYNNYPIKVFNNGDMLRDFTYVDDVITGILRIISNRNEVKSLYKVYNIGNSKPINLMDFIQTIEKEVGREARKIMLPMQPGDLKVTYADVKTLKEDYDYSPDTDLNSGVKNFIRWYTNYYGIR